MKMEQEQISLCGKEEKMHTFVCNIVIIKVFMVIKVI